MWLRVHFHQNPRLQVMNNSPLVLLLPKTFNLFDFSIFWIVVYLMKVIPETRREH